MDCEAAGCEAIGQRGCDAFGMLPGGRTPSSAKPNAEPTPKAVTLSGCVAPHMPGPSIDEMRTMAGPSRTAPDFMQAVSACSRQGSRWT